MLDALEDHTTKVRNVLIAPQSLSKTAGFPVDSWTRCLSEYGLPPGVSTEVPTVDQFELKHAHDRLADRLAVISDELTLLHSIVGKAGYVVTLANTDGLVVALRADRGANQEALIFSQLGKVWDERYTGTNGIGTCLYSEKPTSVYKGEHFFSDYIFNGCAAAPLVLPDCTTWGAVNISVQNPGLNFHTHALALEILRSGSDRISEAIFRNEFKGCAVIRLRGPDGRVLLMAIDDDFAVVAADKEARKVFQLPVGQFAPVSLWSLVLEDKATLALHQDEPRSIELRRHEGSWLRGTMLPPTRRPRIVEGVQISKSAPLSRRELSVSLDDWAGAEPRMVESVRIVRRLSKVRLPVLILGETGVGKDTFARAFHSELTERRGPFVVVNCAAVPESLIESELFGYVGGAFTGARKDGAQGRFVEADGGTLFLDEIGDMPIQLQTRLLRVLDSGEISPLGAGRTRYVDVQFIAATNHHLEKKVQEGTFRQDLFHRLAGVIVDVPPLRDRYDKREVIDLCLERIAESRGQMVSNEARELLNKHTWPGNLRELYLVVTRAAALANGGLVRPEDLLLRLPGAQVGDASTIGPGSHLAKASMRQAERDAIEAALRATKGNTNQVTERLGMSRATLYRRMKEYGLTRRGG